MLGSRDDDDWEKVEPYVPTEAERRESVASKRQARRMAIWMAAAGSVVAAALVITIVALGGSAATSSTVRFLVPSAGMEPIYESSTWIDIDPTAFDSSEPQVGDIVTYHPPRGAGVGEGVCEVEPPRGSPCPEAVHATDDRARFLGRVVAGPGESVAIENGLPVVDGETRFADEMIPCRGPGCQLPNPIVVSEDHYFMMGNDSALSNDSRIWGAVWGEKIYAEVID
ncbi:signal peptidase I [Thermoleophilia bacterium SCSIO 60948]|nr:signal peptidase I [Thermoleophilia bacterium SCSIO 60948]